MARRRGDHKCRLCNESMAWRMVQNSVTRLQPAKGRLHRWLRETQRHTAPCSGNPATRSPPISSFALDCPPRAIHADIVNAESTSSTRAAASRASALIPLAALLTTQLAKISKTTPCKGAGGCRHSKAA